MKIEKGILVYDCDGVILGMFNTWNEARDFMCKDYLEEIKKCEWNDLSIYSYEEIATRICDDLKMLFEHNYIPNWYNTQEIKLDIEF